MQKRQSRTLVALVTFVLAIFDAAACAVAAERPAKLRTAYVSPIGAMAPLWMAAASSAFQSEGLDVELVYIQSNAAIAALIAGEVDAVQISAPAIVPVVLAGGDVTMIAGLLNQMIFSFHAQQEIKSAEQLRGKIVGADRIGTPNDYGVRSALTKLGLKPEIDVQLLRLGGSAIQWTALQSKQIAASALTPPVSFNADARGYTRLAATYDLPYQNIGLVVRKTAVDKRAGIWLRLLRVVQRGISVWYDDPQLSKGVLAKYTRDKDPAMLEKTYGFFTKQAGFNRDLTFTDRGFEQILRFFGSTVLPAAKDASPSQFYDTRIIDKLKK
jgi:ABC-type nitrate/sulfonate/bicarbonate transport system substrate-binding protein